MYPHGSSQGFYEAEVIKTGFLTALAIFLSNILISASYLYLADTKLFIPVDAVLWGRLLVLLFLPGVICFAVGMRTTRLTGDAIIGWAMNCSACLIAGIATVVVIGFYVIFSVCEGAVVTSTCSIHGRKITITDKVCELVYTG